MILNGREVGFYFNVFASIEVAKICPEAKLENIDKLFSGVSYEEDIEATSKFIIALNRGWIYGEKAKNPNFECEELRMEELLALNNADYLEFQNEAMKAYDDGNKRSVTTAPIKNKGKKTVKKDSQSN